MGQTALAIEYAHAFADEYGGGRWQVRCAGKDDLRLALAELATPIGFEFTNDEKKNADLQFERTRRELKKLADAPSPHRCLLLLDNVDRPGLLDPAQVARLNGGDWLHVLATTRLGENELHGAHRDHSFLAIDELPPDDALALSPTESQTLQRFVQAEAYEEFKTMGEWIVAESRQATRPCPAAQNGLPPIPTELPTGIQTGPRVSLRIAFAESGEPIGLKALAWQKTFGTSARELRRIVTGEFGPPSSQRMFSFEADGPPHHGHNPHLAEMEDTLDAEAGPLGNLTLEMNRKGGPREE